MSKRWAESSGGARGTSVSDSLLIKWLAVTILLSVYHIPTKKLFRSKIFNIGRSHGISERSYRSIWAAFKTEDLKATVLPSGAIQVDVADYVSAKPSPSKCL